MVLHVVPSKLRGWVERTDKKKLHHCHCKRNTEETCLKHKLIMRTEDKENKHLIDYTKLKIKQRTFVSILAINTKQPYCKTNEQSLGACIHTYAPKIC